MTDIARPRAGRPTAEQAQARQGELLDAALDMFLEQGFELTTMEAVAASVGMTKRTVYARYPDKAALFLASVQRAIERSITPLDGIDDSDLEAALIAIARLRVGNVMTPQGLRLQRIINTESYRFPAIFSMAYDQATKPVIDVLAALLRKHDAAGTIRLDRPDMAANVFMSMAVSGPVRIIVSGNALDPRDIEDRIVFAVRLFLDGARPR
ncbi:TetR/AcrR family transcriptional regulator [Caulobacter soli]|uniref:TetR/AcrR family transcriptional regulator n=1 Tax=Caulobacter soli TaxID=2708539 RepID=UPI0013EA51FD|nr:TetR/AcrR family transcriptional regulator [Caulobacter soli]